MDQPQAEDFRRRLKAITNELGAHRARIHNEINHNIELAYRHLEDASMRLGKAIQAINGGANVYDKEQVPDSKDAAE